MAAEQRPVVDDLGNIAVHGRSGLVLVVKIETATSGVYEDISASDLFFEISGKLRLALSAGADIYSRQVILTRAQVATLSIGQPYAFAIHDETPSTPSTPWAGTITTFGFKTAPTGVPDVDGEAANWTGATVVIQPGGGSPVVVVNYMGQPGVGIPIGGTVGQYLRKSSATDYATGWDTLTADDVSGLSSTLSTLTSADVSLASRISTVETGYLPLAGGVMAGVLAFIAGTAALPGLAVAGDLNTGIYGVSADVLGVSAGGLNAASFSNGQLSLATAAGGAGVNLAVDGANALALRNGAAAQTLRIYNTYTDPSNYEMGHIAWQSNELRIGTLRAGTGSARSLVFITNGSGRWYMPDSGHFLAAADNTYDVGSGALRPRYIYAGTAFLAALGSVSLPTYSFSGDLNTGMWSPAADTLAWSTGGTERLRITSTGVAVFSAGAAAAPSVTFSNNTTSGLYQDTGGVVRVAISGSRVASFVSTGLQLLAGTTAASGPSLSIDGAATTGLFCPAAGTIGFTGAGVERWRIDSSSLRPGADAAYDLASSGLRIRDGWFSRNVSVGTGITVGYSTTSSAQLHVGAGAHLDILNGALGSLYPQIINSQTSGAAAIGAAVYDGTYNRRVGLFVDNTNSIWGLSIKYSSTTIPFVIIQSGAEQLRLTPGGLLGLGIIPTSFLHVAGATGATLNTTYEPSGWAGLKGRVGMQYRGDGLVSSVNVRLTSLTAGTLDDPTQPGSALVLLGDGSLTLVDTTAGSGVRTFAPMFGVSGTGVTTLYNNLLASADATYDLGASGANRFRDAHLSRTLYAGTAVSAPILYATASVRAQSDSGFISLGASDDVVLTRQAANTLALRNGTNPQTFQINNTRAVGGSDYERLSFAWSGNICRILTEQGGAGVARQLIVGTVGAASFSVATNNVVRWDWNTSGHFLAAADNTYDIASAANRVRNVYSATFAFDASNYFSTASGFVFARVNGAARFAFGPSNQLQLRSDGVLGWTAGTSPTTTPDLFLLRDGAGALALRNAANAQTFRVYETYTDASNYARFGVQLSGSTWGIGPEAAGTGSAARSVTILSSGNLTFQGSGANQWQISSGNFLAVADNTRDIGASGANRPRDLYLGRNFVSGGYALIGSSSSLGWVSRSVMQSPSDGVITLYNNAGALNDFSRLQFGGTTSAFPSWKRSGAVLQARLANDSGFTSIQGKLTTEANAVAETPTATHTLTLYDAAGTAYKVLAVAA